MRAVVDQQLDMLDRMKSARPLTMWGVILFAVGITLFAVASDRDLLRLLRPFAVIAGFWLVSTAFTSWALRKYEATAEANGWLTYNE